MRFIKTSYNPLPDILNIINTEELTYLNSTMSTSIILALNKGGVIVDSLLELGQVLLELANTGVISAEIQVTDNDQFLKLGNNYNGK